MTVSFLNSHCAAKRLFSEAADEGAALAMAIPIHAQSGTLIFVRHRDGRHRVFKLRERWIVSRLRAAGVIAFIQRASLNLSERSRT